MKNVFFYSVILFCISLLLFSCNKNESTKSDLLTTHCIDTKAFLSEGSESFFYADTSFSAITSTPENIITTSDIKYGYPNLRKKDKSYISMHNSFEANSTLEDIEFLYSSKSSTDSFCRYTDKNGYILYYFDISEKTEPEIELDLLYNYVVSISWDDMNYIEIDRFDPNDKDSQKNGKTVKIDPYEFGYYNHIFILIKPSEKADNNSSGIKNLSFNYLLCTDHLDENIRNKLSKEKIYEYHKIKCLTNSSNDDEGYIYYCDSGVNDAHRFADGNGQIIYLFDVSHKISFTLSMSVFQNYLIEVSANGRTWKKVVDFYDIRDQYPNGNYNKDGHLTDGSNRTIVTVCPDDYGIINNLHVKISNSNPDYGWGGTIEYFEIEYYEEKNE